MRKSFLFILMAVLSALSVKGQGRPVLADGISGRDRQERTLLIQAFSPQSDSCLVMSDTLGRFEIDPELMGRMRGNVYLKPMKMRPGVKLAIESPFDSIDAYRQGRERYLAQDYVFMPEEKEEVFYFDPDVTVLKEATVKARRYTVGRDKVTGYLDSLAILSSGEWVCDHGPGKVQYLNNYRGYTHHPDEWGIYDGKRLTPKRGEIYEIIHYIPGPTRSGWMVDMEHMPPRMVLYEGPQYTEEELLEMYGMWKAQGYHPVREFYEPDELDLASATPDFRNLLQWRPAVLTDENGVAEIPFAASDVNTEFVGLVEAVDGTGLLGTQVFTFRVIKE